MRQTAYAYTEITSSLRQARERLERLERISTALLGLSFALLIGAAIM